MKARDARLSRVALFSFLCAVSAYGALTFVLHRIDPPDTPIPCRSIEPGELAGFGLSSSLVLAALALVLGGVGLFQIKRSQGRLKGRWLAHLGIIGVVIVMLQVIAMPSFLAHRDHVVTRAALTTLHAVEARYQKRYPDVGYSPDLTSLGPTADGEAPSATRADLVDAKLALGRYSCSPDTLRYTPRVDATGKIVGYTVRMKSRVARVMNETGEIRILDAQTEDGRSRKYMCFLVV